MDSLLVNSHHFEAYNERSLNLDKNEWRYSYEQRWVAAFYNPTLGYAGDKAVYYHTELSRNNLIP